MILAGPFPSAPEASYLHSWSNQQFHKATIYLIVWSDEHNRLYKRLCSSELNAWTDYIGDYRSGHPVAASIRSYVPYMIGDMGQLLTMTQYSTHCPYYIVTQGCTTMMHLTTVHWPLYLIKWWHSAIELQCMYSYTIAPKPFVPYQIVTRTHIVMIYLLQCDTSLHHTLYGDHMIIISWYTSYCISSNGDTEPFNLHWYT